MEASRATSRAKKEVSVTMAVQELATKEAAAAPGQELVQKGARPSPSVAFVDFPTSKEHVQLRRPSAGGADTAERRPLCCQVLE